MFCNRQLDQDLAKSCETERRSENEVMSSPKVHELARTYFIVAFEVKTFSIYVAFC